MIPTKQEWRVKEKVDTTTPTTSDDGVDLLDDDEAPLIKDGSPPPTDMDMNMVFRLPAEFRGVEEEVALVCLSPKEAFREAQRIEPALEAIVHSGPQRREADLQDTCRRWCCCQPDVVLQLQELQREDDVLTKTNLTLNGMGGNPMEAWVSSPWSSP
jgi:hypothetical protein